MMQAGRLDIDRALSAVLALLLAFVVWLATSRDSRPIDSMPTFPREGNVELLFLNVPEGFEPYAPNGPSLTVSLRGLRAGIQVLGPADVTAVVDLKSVDEEGVGDEHVLPVRASCSRCGRLGVRIGAPKPREIAVRLDALKSISKTVSFDLPPAADEERVLIQSNAIPPQVSITGASRQIDRLDHVMAIVPLQVGSDAGASSFDSLKLRMLDSTGTAIEGLIAQPSRVDAQVTIGERGVSLQVVPRLTGEVPDGYFLAGFDYEPHSVQILGAAAQLAEILEEGLVGTEEIDVTGFTTDQVLDVALALPAEVRTDRLPNRTITVTLKVSALPGSTPIDVPVEAIGVRGDRIVSISPATVRVLVSGPRPVLDALESGDVRAIVDAQGLGPGKHRLTIEVRAPVTLKALSVTPDVVELVIESDDGADKEEEGTNVP